MLPDDLVSELRAACKSGRGNYGHRLLCGKAADEIERLRGVLKPIADGCYTEKGAEQLAKVGMRTEAEREQADRERSIATEQYWKDKQGDEYGSY